MRFRFLVLAMMALLSSAVAAPSLKLVPLKPDLYVVEDTYYAAENSMVYVGRDHVTVIGATWSPVTADILIAEIGKITSKPITEVVLQNHDLDRTGGDASFKRIGAKLIAIQATRDLLAKEGVQQIADTRKFAPNYPDVPIVLPDTIVGDDFTLQNGAIRGFWLGASHKPDDIFIWFPNEKVLYGGCALKPFLGNTVGADLVEYPKTLTKLKALNLPIETIVAGHGAPVQGPDLIDRYLGFLAGYKP